MQNACIYAVAEYHRKRNMDLFHIVWFISKLNYVNQTMLSMLPSTSNNFDATVIMFEHRD